MATLRMQANIAQSFAFVFTGLYLPRKRILNYFNIAHNFLLAF